MRKVQSEFAHANILNRVPSIYVTLKDNFFLSLETGFSDLHRVSIKPVAGEKKVQCYGAFLAKEPL